MVIPDRGIGEREREEEEEEKGGGRRGWGSHRGVYERAKDINDSGGKKEKNIIKKEEVINLPADREVPVPYLLNLRRR